MALRDGGGAAELKRKRMDFGLCRQNHSPQNTPIGRLSRSCLRAGFPNNCCDNAGLRGKMRAKKHGGFLSQRGATL